MAILPRCDVIIILLFREPKDFFDDFWLDEGPKPLELDETTEMGLFGLDEFKLPSCFSTRALGGRLIVDLIFSIACGGSFTLVGLIIGG